MSDWGSVKKVLAARLDNIGDVLMLGPALAAIKSALPSARLTLWASPAGAKTAELLPTVDDVLVTRPVWQDLGQLPLDAGRELRLADDLRTRRFDAAMIFTSFSQSPYPPAYVCYLAEIPIRAGQSREFGGSLLTQWIKPPPDDAHQVERNLNLVESLGFLAPNREMSVVVPEAARASLAERLSRLELDPHRPLAVIHPGASCPARTYPAIRYVGVGRSLVAAGLQVIVSGGDRERELGDRMAAKIGAGALSLAGQTSLTEFAALIDRADVVIANDTSAMHLADAVRTPSVITFSGTDLESQWRPRSAPSRLLRRPTDCSPCYLFVCPFQQECLDIPAREVAEAALDLLGIVRSRQDLATEAGGWP